MLDAGVSLMRVWWCVAPIITSNASVMCAHGGRVELIPRQAQVTIDGAYVMCAPDLEAAKIVGCKHAPSPCTTVISVLPGSMSPTVSVGGQPAYIATLSGITDSVPPSAITVTDPGQSTVEG